MFPEWLFAAGALAALFLPLAIAWLIAGREPARRRRKTEPVVRSSPPPHQAPPQ